MRGGGFTLDCRVGGRVGRRSWAASGAAAAVTSETTVSSTWRTEIDMTSLSRRGERHARRREDDRLARRVGGVEGDLRGAARLAVEVRAHGAAGVGLRDDARAAGPALIEELAELGRRQHVVLYQRAGAVEEIEHPV